MAVVTELVTKFKFVGDIGKLKGFNTSLAKGISLSAKAAAGFVAAAGAVTAFVTSTLDGADAMVQLSRSTGVSVEKIQTLGYVASQSGSSSEALEGTLNSLSKTIGSAAQKGSADFSRLGISVRGANGEIKKADQILMEVSSSFKRLNLSMAEQKSIASSLGIDESLIQMLNRSSSEISVLQARARALGIVTQEQSNKIADYNDSITTIKFGMQNLTRQMAIGLSPTIKELADDFVNFLIQNDFSSAIGKISKGFGTLVNGAIRLIKFINDLIKATIGWKGAILLIGAAIAMTPIGKMILIITAVLLLIDDLIVAFKGGKSVIRDFFLEFFGFDIAPVLQGILKAFLKFVKIIKDIFSGLKDIIVGIFTFDFDKIVSGFKKVVDSIGAYFKLIFQPLIDMLTKPLAAVKKFFGFGDDTPSIPSTFNDVGSLATPQLIPSGNITNSSRNVNQDVNIQVYSTDPQAAGQAVVDNMSKQLSYADTMVTGGSY